MKFTYQDKDYEFADADTWTTREAMLVQEYSGKRPLEILADFANGGAFGMHAMAWVTLRRAGVEVAWADLELSFAETLVDIMRQEGKLPPVEDPSPASTPPRKAGQRAASGSKSRSGKS